MRILRPGVCVLLAVLACGCGGGGKSNPAPRSVHDGAEELEEVLAQLAKGHSDKTKLAMYVGVPLLKKTDPAVKAFATKMGREHGELLKELTAYAKAKNISLAFEYGTDLQGRAQEEQEGEEGKALQAAGGKDFQVMLLVLEYADFEWQKNLIKATLTSGRPLDAQLRGYLEKSLKVHDEGLREIEGLLKRCEFK